MDNAEATPTVPGIPERLADRVLPDEEVERFEGREVIFRSSHLRATVLVGPMAGSKLEPGMRVRCQVDAVVVDVDHKTIKQVPDCLERIHVLNALEESAVIVEEL